MDVILTAAAEKFIRRMLRMGGSADSGFRLVVTPGGCSGLAGDFSVEPAPRQGDLVLDHGGMRFFLPAESRALLEGVTIDFADTATQTGLRFPRSQSRRQQLRNRRAGAARHRQCLDREHRRRP